MPKRRTIRSRGNRPRRRRSSRKIAQVSTGIPTFQRVSGNPPVLKELSTQTVKVAFYLNVIFKTGSKESFLVNVSKDPFGQNYVQLTLPDSHQAAVFYLDIDEIYQAAYVRAFGSMPKQGDQSTISTEMALQSAAFYGPLGAGSIRMGLDFGPGTPGILATDEGTYSSRPAVKASTPRLHWDRIHSVVAGDAVVAFWVYGLYPPGTNETERTLTTGRSYRHEGRMDFTVHVRRSWLGTNAASSLAAKTIADAQMSDDFFSGAFNQFFPTGSANTIGKGDKSKGKTNAGR